MELAKGVSLEYKEGKLLLSAEVAALLVPKIEEIKAKVLSGELDLVKGTSLEVAPTVMVLDLVVSYLQK